MWLHERLFIYFLLYDTPTRHRIINSHHIYSKTPRCRSKRCCWRAKRRKESCPRCVPRSPFVSPPRTEAENWKPPPSTADEYLEGMLCNWARLTQANKLSYSRRRSRRSRREMARRRCSKGAEIWHHVMTSDIFWPFSVHKVLYQSHSLLRRRISKISYIIWHCI